MNSETSWCTLTLYNWYIKTTIIGNSAKTFNERIAFGIKLKETTDPSLFFFSVWILVIVKVSLSNAAILTSEISDTLIVALGSNILFKFWGKSLYIFLTDCKKFLIWKICFKNITKYCILYLYKFIEYLNFFDQILSAINHWEQRKALMPYSQQINCHSIILVIHHFKWIFWIFFQ